MTQKYEISTLKDIFDKVPLERIDVCMAEIAQGIKQAKATDQVLKAAARELGIEVQSAIEFPSVCTWIDDDKGEITANLVVEPGGEPIATITTRAA